MKPERKFTECLEEKQFVSNGKFQEGVLEKTAVVIGLAGTLQVNARAKAMSKD